ncbi:MULTISPECIES: DUF4270 family protein [Chitinophagaceae]
MKSRTSRFCFGTLAIFFIAFGLHSCTKADITFGDQWVDNNYSQVTLLDTITPQMSTIFVDSFATNGTGYAIVGVYKDPYFGVVNASTYLRLQPPTISLTLADTLNGATYDSTVLYMKLKHGEYGDTTQTMTVSVYPLAQGINYYDNTSSLYNVTSFEANSTAIGSRAFTFNPNVDHPVTGDSLLIKLDDTFGKDLYTKMRTNSAYMQSATDFLDYLKGLKISATAANNNGFVFNAADSVSIRVYYTVNGLGERISNYQTFTLSNSAYQFNNITVDRSGTELGTANIGRTNRSIPSSETGHFSYLQQSTMTAIKLTFPTVKSLTYQSNYLKLVRAVLVVEPKYSSYLPYYAVPPSLYIGATDNYTNSYSESLGTASSPYLNTNTRQYSYSFDITSYISGTELASDDVTGRGLILYLPASAYKSTLNRLVIGDAQSELKSQGGIKLQLYYLSVQ